MTRPIRILGIDPGLRRTGWGVVEIAGNRLAFIGCGSVTTNDRDALAARLLAIYDGLLLILEQYRPDEAAVEATFVNKDATATLKLGQARGIAMVRTLSKKASSASATATKRRCAGWSACCCRKLIRILMMPPMHSPLPSLMRITGRA